MRASGTEVVLLDWVAAERAAPASVAACLARLTAAGVDVVVVAAADALPPIAVPSTGAGRAYLWSVEPPLVRDLAEGGSPWAPPVPDPRAWAERWLAGPGAPDAVREVRERVLQTLDELAAAAEDFPEVTADPAWQLEVERPADAKRERAAESWLAVANGRTGTRGSPEEGGRDSDPAVYVAGVFGCTQAVVPVPELVVGPEWARLHPRVGDREMVSGPDATVDRRVLDFRQALLLRRWCQPLPAGAEWRFRSARFASQADRAVVGLLARAEVAGPGRPGDAEVTLDGPIPLPAPEGPIGEVEETTEAGYLTVAVRAREGGEATFAISTDATAGRLERLATVDRAWPQDDRSDERSGDRSGDRSGALAALAGAHSGGFGTLRARHRVAWRERWRDADVTVGDDPWLQRAIRFALYHLISSGDPESDRASVGARGLTGPGYGGRVFWDTEVFVLPFFLWTHPPTARAILAYRHRTLPAAKAKARRLGYEGALFAWESADTGEESTPPYVLLPDGTRLDIVTGDKEHHISADIAWAAWQYWRVTGDDVFLADIGGELIVETARFWASRTTLGPDGRRHIDGVVGPDEYHEHVDDNAFTNVMARWNLRTAADLCERLPALTSRLSVPPPEIDTWREVADQLVDGFDPETQRYEQFAGFSGLEDLRAVDLAPRPFTGELVLGVPGVRRSQLVKQADVVMLAHLLPDEVPARVALANYRHYEPRTCHGSSLSPAIHASVAARVGILDDAETYFRMAAALDLDDRMGNSEHGVHVATQGGLWQAAVVGFGGVRPAGDAVRIDPRLPASWDSLAFAIQWRGTRIHVDAAADRLTLHLDRPALIAIGDAEPSLLGAGSHRARRSGGGWGAAEPLEAQPVR